jgi:hypothetical protein
MAGEKKIRFMLLTVFLLCKKSSIDWDELWIELAQTAWGCDLANIERHLLLGKNEKQPRILRMTFAYSPVLILQCAMSHWCVDICDVGFMDNVAIDLYAEIARW